MNARHERPARDRGAAIVEYMLIAALISLASLKGIEFVSDTAAQGMERSLNDIGTVEVVDDPDAEEPGAGDECPDGGTGNPGVGNPGNDKCVGNAGEDPSDTSNPGNGNGNGDGNGNANGSGDGNGNANGSGDGDGNGNDDAGVGNPSSGSRWDESAIGTDTDHAYVCVEWRYGHCRDWDIETVWELSVPVALSDEDGDRLRSRRDYEVTIRVEHLVDGEWETLEIIQEETDDGTLGIDVDELGMGIGQVRLTIVDVDDRDWDGQQSTITVDRP